MEEEISKRGKALVMGASGATGRLLIEELLKRGLHVKAMLRDVSSISAELRAHENIELIEASVLDLSDSEMAKHVEDCDAVISCLGHTMNWKGIYGKPRRLVTEATRRMCAAIEANRLERCARYILMNTTGNRNRDLEEKISFAQKSVITMLRLLLPPHVDNEKAAEVLRSEVGQGNASVEWVAVRPDGLTKEDHVSEYELHPSPTRSAIFDAGKTSRINVAHFMAELVVDDDLWRRWKGCMPVIYNRGE